jgi:hypothetical protein
MFDITLSIIQIILNIITIYYIIKLIKKDK